MSSIHSLRDARTAQNRTVREVAQAAGLHENTIRNAETGRNSPTLDAVQAWATALGLQLVLLPVDADKKSANGDAA